MNVEVDSLCLPVFAVEGRVVVVVVVEMGCFSETCNGVDNDREGTTTG